MNPFNRKTALRIALISCLLALIASPLAWLVARENAEESTVALAMEESRRLWQHFSEERSLDGQNAKLAAQAIVGGLFDIAEIYDAQGSKQAEATTPAGEHIESKLPKHRLLPPKQGADLPQAHYENLKIDEEWILRVFVPLTTPGPNGLAHLSGYFEGVRIIPAWQREQLRENALSAALMIGLAALLCGAAIYPVVVHLSADNVKKAREVLDSHISMMEALGRAIAKRDSDTGAHNYRVAWIAARIGETLGVSDSEMQSLIVGSFLHDVGKIGIPDAILLKPGKLDEAEFEIMRTHVNLGEEIVKGIGWLDGASAVVAGHHEKWNGQGYPRRLSGEAIPLAARIFAVADVFDALSSKRPYKQPLPFDAVMNILEKDTGSHFDPSVMAAFRKIAAEISDTLRDMDESGARSLLTERVHQHFGL